MKLGDIIDLEMLQDIQESFSKATGFASIIVDYKGQPLIEYSCFSAFCNKLREDKCYLDRCLRSDAHGSLEAFRRAEVYIYKCHAGLVDFAIPIMVDGEYVASMMCGQVLAEDSDSFDCILEPENEFKDDKELNELYNKINVVSSDKIRQAANLMFVTLNYIVEQHILSKKNANLLGLEKEIEDLEKKFKEFEIKYYHSQINPHFLLNVLNIASRQAYLEDAQKTQQILFSVADIYRNSLRDSSFLIPLNEELNNVNNYIFIQKIRFSDKLSYEVFVEDEILEYSIPSMSLQVLVENAVTHGLEPKDELGFIKVVAKKENEFMNFAITNNGLKINKSILQKLNSIMDTQPIKREVLSTGIYNMHKRLEYFYNDKYDLSFKNTDKGVVVSLKIPLIKY